MIKQLIIDGKKSYDDFGLLIATRNITQPKKKIVKESVPFSNVVYDFSKLNGEIYWEERTLEYTFDIAELSTEEMEVVKSKVYNWLMNIHDEDIYDPYIGDYHFHGSFDSDSWSEDFGAGEIKVSFSVYPYKISNEDNSISTDEMGISSDGTLTNSVASVVRELTIDGRSTQATTNGYSLVDFSKPYTITNAEITFKNDILTISTDSSLSYDGPRYDILEIIKNGAGKTLKLDYESVTQSNPIGDTAMGTITLKKADSNVYHTLIGKHSENYVPAESYYTIPEDVSDITSATMILFTNNSNTVTGESNVVTITKPMLHYGSSELEYERFTGGVPSPNPDFPSEIESVGYENLYDYVNNPFTGDYYSSDGTTSSNGNWKCTADYINVEPNTSYTVTNGIGTEWSFYIIAFDSSYNFIERITFSVANYPNGYAFTTGSNVYYIKLQGHLSKITPSEIMLNEGSTAQPYIPYGKYGIEIKTTNGIDTNTTVMQLNAPLRSLPNGVKDIAYIKNNKLYVDRYVGSVVLDGSETITVLTQSTTGYNRYLIEKTLNNKMESSEWVKSNILCDYFVPLSNSNQYSGQEGILLRVSKQNQILILDKSFTEISDITNFLIENNTQVDYELATPVTEELGDITIPTYDDTTHISLSDETTFEVKYDELVTKTIINNSSHRVPITLISSGNFTVKTLGNLGKNLLNVDKNLTLNDTYGIDVNIPIGTYKVSFLSESHNGANYPYLRFYNNNVWIMLYANNGEQTVNISKNETKIYLYTNGMSASQSKGVSAIINQLMISKDGGLYEPYQGIESSYSVGEGVYKSGVYLEQGETTLTITGYGKITFSFVEEVF